MKQNVHLTRNIPIHKVDSIFVALICPEVVHVADIGATIANFRKLFPQVMFQGVNPNHIFGKRHIFEVIKIALEANKREFKIAKRLEMELLLRLICCNQVDKAIAIGGIKNNNAGCFVVLSNRKQSINESVKHLSRMFVNQNSSLLNATKQKMINICRLMEFSRSDFSSKEFLGILTEKAALVSL